MRRGEVLAVLLFISGLSGILCRAQEAESSGSFAFAVYGDCRTGHEIHRQIVAQMLALKPAFVVGAGDYVTKGDDKSDWRTFADITGKMRETVRFYPAKGNHDVERKGRGLYDKYLKLPTNTGQMRYYSFDHGDRHFVVLDSTGSLAAGGEQYRWLQADLKAAEGKSRHRFVVLHHPLYTLIPLRKAETDARRRQLLPLLKEFKVCAVFAGHDHYFFFTRRDGVPQVVTGGGGAPLYPLNPFQARPGDKWGLYRHFLWVEVSPDQVKVSVRDTSGQTKEEFQLCSHGKKTGGTGAPSHRFDREEAPLCGDRSCW